MPLVAAAVCPSPPVVVPAVAAGAASELDGLRAACDAAVGRVLAARPDAVLIVGAGKATRWITGESYGSLAPWGVPLEVPLDPARTRGAAGLSLAVTVGAWLLGRHRHAAPVAALTVAADATAGDCAELGAGRVAPWRERVGLLAIGDGSACRGRHSPGYDDPRAEAFDAAVARALAGADRAALLALDPVLTDELRCAGRPAWQVLAGAAGGTAWRGTLHHTAAPYGVAYFVASWEPV